MVTGADGGAAQSIMKCLRMAKNYRIVATGIDPQCIGVYRGDVGYVVSRNWLVFKEQLRNICSEEGVELVIPGSDFELSHFVENKSWYKKYLPPILIDWKNVRLARDKYLLQQILKEKGFPFLETWIATEIAYALESKHYPLIIKPRHGLGSRMTFKNVGEREISPLIDYSISNGWAPIIQEQVEGEEYSCMTLRGKDGELLCHTVAWSFKKFGQSYKTVILNDNQEIRDFICLLSEKLHSIGPLSIQLVKDWKTGDLKVFELNARFSGAQVVRAYAGVNMPDLAVRNWLDGVKEYPKVKKSLVAFWYHDFAYGDLSLQRLTTITGKVNGKKLSCPKLL